MADSAGGDPLDRCEGSGLTAAPTFAAVLQALEVAPGRPHGLKAAAFVYGGPDGQLRDEAWGVCPACRWCGLWVKRLEDGRADVVCRNGGCSRDAVLEALASALLEKAKAVAA